MNINKWKIADREIILVKQIPAAQTPLKSSLYLPRIARRSAILFMALNSRKEDELWIFENVFAISATLNRRHIYLNREVATIPAGDVAFFYFGEDLRELVPTPIPEGDSSLLPAMIPIPVAILPQRIRIPLYRLSEIVFEFGNPITRIPATEAGLISSTIVETTRGFYKMPVLRRRVSKGVPANMADFEFSGGFSPEEKVGRLYLLPSARVFWEMLPSADRSRKRTEHEEVPGS